MPPRRSSVGERARRRGRRASAAETSALPDGGAPGPPAESTPRPSSRQRNTHAAAAPLDLDADAGPPRGFPARCRAPPAGSMPCATAFRTRVEERLAGRAGGRSRRRGCSPPAASNVDLAPERARRVARGALERAEDRARRQRAGAGRPSAATCAISRLGAGRARASRVRARRLERAPRARPRAARCARRRRVAGSARAPRADRRGPATISRAWSSSFDLAPSPERPALRPRDAASRTASTSRRSTRTPDGSSASGAAAHRGGRVGRGASSAATRAAISSTSRRSPSIRSRGDGRRALRAVRAERVLGRVGPVADRRPAARRAPRPSACGRAGAGVATSALSAGRPLEVEEPARERVEQLARLDPEVPVAVLGHRLRRPRASGRAGRGPATCSRAGRRSGASGRSSPPPRASPAPRSRSRRSPARPRSTAASWRARSRARRRWSSPTRPRDVREGGGELRELPRARLDRLGAALGRHHGRVHRRAHLVDERADVLRGARRRGRPACGSPRPPPRSACPLSPAPAASMVALMARMLVCSASSLMISTTPPICCDFRPRSSMWFTIELHLPPDRPDRLLAALHGLVAGARRRGGVRRRSRRRAARSRRSGVTWRAAR